MGPVRGAGAWARRRSLSATTTSHHGRTWRVLERTASPGELHGQQPDPHGARLACVCRPLSPAVVIGSSQDASDFDEGRLVAANMALVRRHSGGGAVLVAPGQQVWVDVFVPSGDELAEDDVGKSFHWLGEVFAASLASVLGLSPATNLIEVNRGPALKTSWSEVLCFAGLGPGEVTVAGRKVVGMSQRRKRAGAWIHAMAVVGSRSVTVADFLAEPASSRGEARALLGSVGLPDAEHLVSQLTEDLLNRLN